jgi:G6PDH family F420-dependent oxidoreductase
MSIRIGYTMMCEQAPARQLVRDVASAEAAGFDFSVISDHYFPWLESQGHSPYAWSVLGAAAQATESIPLMTYVTCPIIRYHPVVVAQKAATVQELSEGRFSLGLGAGENLNEHVVGERWPPVSVRHEMLEEAVELITRLLDGETVTFRGKHFAAEDARLWDPPATRVPIGIAVSGRESCALAGRYADVMVAVEPKSHLGELFDAAGGAGKPRVGQMPVCYGTDEEACTKIAHDQFRWFGGGWKVNADLPSPAGFDAASQFVTADDVAEAIPCGPDIERHVAAVKKFVDAGFTDVALIQVGADSQDEFIAWCERELLPALKEL